MRALNPDTNRISLGIIGTALGCGPSVWSTRLATARGGSPGNR